MLSRFEIGSNPPDLVGYLLGNVLKSGEQDDACLALKTANHFDRKNGSRYGRMVVNKIIKTYEKNKGKVEIATPVGMMLPEDEENAELVKEIAIAIGKEEGPKVSIFDVSERESGILKVWDNSTGQETVEEREPYNNFHTNSGLNVSLDEIGPSNNVIMAEGSAKEMTVLAVAYVAMADEPQFTFED